MDELVWEEPPRVSRGQSRAAFLDIAEKLRANPGVWAMVAKFDRVGRAGSIAGHINRGRYEGITAGEFEAVSRSVEGEYRVYARFVGIPTAETTGETTADPNGVTIG